MANVVTLDDVVTEQMTTNEKLEKIDNRFSDFFTMLRADKLDMLEAMRERNKKVASVPAGDAAQKDTLDLGLMDLLSMFSLPALFSKPLALLANILRLLTASLLAFTGDLIKGIKNLKNSEYLKKLKISIVNFFEPLTKFFKDLKYETQFRLLVIQEKIKDFFKTGPLQKVQDFFTKFRTSFVTFIQKIESFVKPIAEVVGKVLGVLGKIATKAIVEPIGKLITFLSKFGGFFKTLGRLFVPLGVILTLIDGIKIGIEEFGKLGDDAGPLAYIKAGFNTITKTVLGVFTFIGDLLKDLVSWISEKLGFESLSKWLDSFNLVDIGNKLIDLFSNLVFDKLFNMEWWSGLFTDMGNAISDAFDTVWDSVTSFFAELKDSAIQLTKNFVKSMLPAPDAFTFQIPKTGIQALDSMLPLVGEKINLNPFPDSLYQFANSPPPPKIQPQANVSAPTMEQTQRNQALASSGMDRMGGGTTIVNNNNTYAPRTSTSQVSLADSGMPSSTSNNGLRGSTA